MQFRDTWKQSSDPIFASREQSIWIIGYDPENKNYRYTAYFDDGTISFGTITCNGNIWRYAKTGKLSLGGKQYSARLTQTLADDRMSRLDELELSLDDETWLLFDDEKWTKIKPAVKK